MKKPHLIAKLTLSIAAVLSVGTAAYAGVSLADLILPGSTLSIGDKTFGDFNFTKSPSWNIDASSIDVSTLQQGGVYYLVFQGPFTASAGQVCDLGLFYSVTASGGNKITDIDQAFNLSGGAGGLLHIGETVFNNGFFNGQVAQSTVSYDAQHPGLPTIDFEDPPGEVLQGDVLHLSSPQTKVWVTKDILLDASAPGAGAVGATIIAQSFHQGSPVSDGGATVALLGVALSGLGLLRRKLS